MDKDYTDSTMISSYQYFEDTLILEIEFRKNGAVWNYFDVPESTYWEMKSSGSIGKFFLSSIKGHYSESQVG